MLSGNTDNLQASVKTETDHNNPSVSEQQHEVRFVPPLFRQRYTKVRDVVEENQAVKVIDYGCADCNFITYLKTISTLEEIAGVDIDEKILLWNKNKVKPLTSDFLKPRIHPLVLRIYCGELPFLDPSIQGYDAVTMIEVIEHLEADVLQALPRMLFGLLRPKLVVITTPNSDYNELFPNFTGFRHEDHKFEWSQIEFRDWCEEVCSSYGYNVHYDGCGSPPADQVHLGPCSQIAIFHLGSDISQTLCTSPADIMTYKLIAECHHPHKTKQPWCVELQAEVDYYLRRFARGIASVAEETEDLISVPIERLLMLEPILELCSDQQQLLSFLHDKNYIISHDQTAVIYDLCESSDSESFDPEESDLLDNDIDVNSSSLVDDSEYIQTEESWDTEESLCNKNTDSSSLFGQCDDWIPNIDVGTITSSSNHHASSSDCTTNTRYCPYLETISSLSNSNDIMEGQFSDAEDECIF